MKTRIHVITDEKYPTIQSFIKSNGKINGNVVNADEFKNLKIYKQILEQTKELDQFGDKLTLTMRILHIIHKSKLTYCPICGKAKIFFQSLQKRISLCRHHIVTKTGKTNLRAAKKELWKKFYDLFENCKDYILTDDEFSIELNELSNKQANYAFSMSKDHMNFYHDLVLKTVDLVPYVKEKPQFAKRIYLLKNNLTELPKCKYCHVNTCVYINSQVGFLDHCNECADDFLRDTLSAKINLELNELIDTTKYEIVSTPMTLNSENLVVKHRECGKVSEVRINNGALHSIDFDKLCKHCYHTASSGEEAVYEFVKSICDNEVLHKYGCRKIIPPKELDIYIPSKKLAIEYDGMYWHSTFEKEARNYHLNKTERCEEKCIQLIHIFENEWLYKQDIVKSRLKNLLGIYDATVYARKCEVREVTSKESKIFQETNHIQGACNSSVNLGLYFNNELISLMTFGKCRFNKNYEWELLRFCNKLGYHVPGAAGKLLKHFEKTYNPTSLISYADRRWSRGKLYDALGFTLDHISRPNYWYYKNGDYELKSRVNFQKHKLKDKLEKFDPKLSESENMKNNGYLKIYDCGNLVYVKTY